MVGQTCERDSPGNKIRTAGADERTGQQRVSPLHPKAQEGQAWMKFTISSFSVRKVFQNKHTVHTHTPPLIFDPPCPSEQRRVHVGATRGVTRTISAGGGCCCVGRRGRPARWDGTCTAADSGGGWSPMVRVPVGDWFCCGTCEAKAAHLSSCP